SPTEELIHLSATAKAGAGARTATKPVSTTAATTAPAIEPASAAAATTVNLLPLPETSATVCDPAEAEVCPEIKAGSSEETDMINAFKNSEAHGDCIRGGFFGHYANRKYTKGRCVIDPDT